MVLIVALSCAVLPPTQQQMSTPDTTTAAPSPVDSIKRGNVANIVKKLKAGKTLTATDIKAIESFDDTQAQAAAGAAPKLADIEVKIDDLMDWLCSGKRNLFNLEASGVVVKKSPGRYLLRECVRNRIQDLLGKGSVTTSEREAEEQKKLVAERRLAENRADREANHYISRALTVRLFRNNLMTARTRLLTLADRIGQQVTVAPSIEAARKIIRDEMHNALEGLATLTIEELIDAEEGEGEQSTDDEG